MKTTFRDSLERLAPPWLRGPWGQRFLWLFGIQLDVLAESRKQAELARYPGVGHPDALPYIGADRKIVRGFFESEANYARRCLTWLDDHRTRGNAVAMFRQLRGLLHPQAIMIRTVDNSGNWNTWELDSTALVRHRTIDGDGITEWDWDGNTSHWWRFWLILYSPPGGGPWNVRTIGQGLIGQGLIGTDATAEQRDTLRAVVKDWKPEHMKCSHILICFDATAFDPTNDPHGTIGTGDLPEGDYAPRSSNRRDGVAYMLGVS